MKKHIAVLVLIMLVCSLFSTACADDISLEDMQKHTSADLSCLADYTAFYDDNTYSALFFTNDMIATYEHIDFLSVDWTTYDPDHDILDKEPIDTLYLGFEVSAVNGTLIFIPCIIGVDSCEIYFKAGNSRYSMVTTQEVEATGDKLHVFNKRYSLLVGETAKELYSYRLSKTGFDMLTSLTAYEDATVTTRLGDPFTITAEDKQTISDFLSDIESMGREWLTFPETQFFTCYTDWD